MNYFEILPDEIFNLIINELNLIDLPKLSRTDKYLNNKNFPIESKINQSIPNLLSFNETPIKFILLNKWSTMIYSQNPKFMLSHKITYNFANEILFTLIKKNLILGIKMLIDHTPHLINYSLQINDMILQHDHFSYIKTFCLIEQQILILTYLYGTEDLLNFFLNSDIINNINNDKITEQSENLLDFIDNMELKNKWNSKPNVYTKISLSCIFQEIANNNTFRVKFILDNSDKNIYENGVSSCPYYIIPYFYNNNVANLILCGDLKIKIILFLMASQMGSKLTQLLSWLYPQTMLNIVFNSFDWSNEDIELIKKTDKIYDFGVCDRIFYKKIILIK
jgi:hypothetical protein